MIPYLNSTLLVPRASARTRRIVWAFACLVQVFSIGFGTFGDLRPSSTLGAHVEPAGTNKHYNHDDRDCAACAVRHIVGAPTSLARPILLSVADIAAPPSRETSPILERRLAPSAPRAPPASQRIGA